MSCGVMLSVVWSGPWAAVPRTSGVAQGGAGAKAEMAAGTKAKVAAGVAGADLSAETSVLRCLTIS